MVKIAMKSIYVVDVGEAYHTSPYYTKNLTDFCHIHLWSCGHQKFSSVTLVCGHVQAPHNLCSSSVGR